MGLQVACGAGFGILGRMGKEKTQTLLTQTRKSRGLSLDQVAAEVGTDPTNLSRVEKGAQVPKRELARALFEFYGGAVPLGAIYDPQYVPVVEHARSARG